MKFIDFWITVKAFFRIKNPKLFFGILGIVSLIVVVIAFVMTLGG